MKHKHKYKNGFTIVELTIVIIVIGILASITLISYSGISSRAVVVSLKSDLSNASSSLKTFKIDDISSSYPLTIDCSIPDSTTNKCIKISSDSTHNYQPDVALKTFCLDITKNDITYNLDQSNNILAGPCPSTNLDAGNILSYTEGSSEWYDLSGNSYDATLLNSPSYNSSVGYISFNGINQSGVHYYYPAINSSVHNYYIEVWFKMRTLHTTQYESNGHIYGSQNGNNIVLYLNTLNAGTSNLNMIYDDSRYSTTHDSTYELPPDTWVCWGINGYTTSDLEYYVNGELDRTRFTTAQGPKWLPNPATIAYDSRWDKYSELDIAIIKIYNQNLSAEEIKYNFEETKSRFGL